MNNLSTHPGWCVPARCDISNLGGAHRSALRATDGPDGTVVASLWQSSIGRPKVRLTVSPAAMTAAGSPAFMLDLAHANLLGNLLCDLAAAAGGTSS